MTQSELETLIKPVKDFLWCDTPQAWLEKARENEAILLIDHAHCEKKAASTGLGLIYCYPERTELLPMVSQLVREEMLHFEQVIVLIEERGHRFDHMKASSYAASLLKHCNKQEPAKLIDTLIISAIIEARSCERFYALSTHVDEGLAQYYRYLLKSESRHFEDYLLLAKRYASQGTKKAIKQTVESSVEALQQRIDFFLAEEQRLIEAEDPLYRFHSGVPPKH